MTAPCPHASHRTGVSQARLVVSARSFWLEEHEGKQLGPFVGLLIKWEAVT